MWPGFDSSKHVLRIDLALDLENHGIIEIDSFLAIIWIIQLEKEVNRLNDNSICMLSTVSILYLKVLDLLGSLIWIIHGEISPIVLSILIQQQWSIYMLDACVVAFLGRATYPTLIVIVHIYRVEVWERKLVLYVRAEVRKLLGWVRQWHLNLLLNHKLILVEEAFKCIIVITGDWILFNFFVILFWYFFILWIWSKWIISE